MTGEEYLNLTEGDLCRLITNISTEEKTWKKGLIVKVLYRDRYKDSIYFKNLTAETPELNYSIKELNPNFILGAMEVYKKCGGNYITKFEHKFNAGDTVWYMKNNKPLKDSITTIHIVMSRGAGIEWYYTTTEAGVTNLSDNEMFATKDELLDSLR